MPSTITRASSFGHVAAQIFSGRRRLGVTWTRSRLSSPAIAADGVSGAGVPYAEVSTAMTDHLFPQLALDPDRQLDGIRRVHAARPVQVDLEVPDDPAGTAAEQYHPVPEADRLAYLVGNEEHGQATPPPDSLKHLVQQVAGHRVERAERLVHQQHVRFLAERAGQRHPLAHPAGKLVRPLAAEAAEVHKLEQFGGPLPPLGPGR